MDSLRTQSLAKKTKESPPAPADGLLDLNLLPARHLPRRFSYRTVALWLLFLLLLGLLLPNYERFGEASRALSLQQSELGLARRDLTAAQAEPQEMEDLRLSIDQAESRLLDLNAAVEAINIQAIAWGPTVAAIRARAPEGLQIDHIDQAEDVVTIQGVSQAYRDALIYGQALRRQGEYSEVIVNFVRRLDAESSVQASPDTADDSAAMEGGSEDQAAPEPVYEYAFELQVTLPGAAVVEAEGSEGQ